jgi:hypothetical protein
MSKFLLAGAILAVMILNTESYASAKYRAYRGDLSSGVSPMQVFHNNSYESLINQKGNVNYE